MRKSYSALLWVQNCDLKIGWSLQGWLEFNSPATVNKRKRICLSVDNLRDSLCDKRTLELFCNQIATKTQNSFEALTLHPYQIHSWQTGEWDEKESGKKALGARTSRRRCILLNIDSWGHVVTWIWSCFWDLKWCWKILFYTQTCSYASSGVLCFKLCCSPASLSSSKFVDSI